jgi:polyhydroxybutyrate depolymerase
MRRRHGIQSPILLALAASAAGGAQLPPGDHALTLEHGGSVRHYQVHVPAGATRTLPAVLVFHGGGSRGSALKRYSRLDAVADSAGFVTVYPDGSGQLERLILTWNAGFCCGYARRLAIDDVGFVARLLDRLGSFLALDTRRVYATGFSNGAMLVHRLALELSDRIAAVAPVAGAWLPPSGPHPGRPTPVLHVHSVDDQRAPYQGGLGPPSPVTEVRVPHPAVTAVLARWAARNGCSPAPERTEVRRIPDGHRAERWVWPRCADGTSVEHWKLFGPGHVWPGASPLAPGILGEPTAVIDVNREIWDFLRRFSLPD